MSFRGIFVAAACLVLVLASPAFAADEGEGQGILSKKNAFAVKAGYHFGVTSEYLGYWDLETKNVSGVAAEFCYERFLWRFFSVTANLGYTYSTYDEHLGNTLSIRSERFSLSYLYLSPSLKVWLPVGEKFGAYVGGGPDLYYVFNDFMRNSELTKEESCWGGHALVGAEYVLNKKPDTGNLFALGVEYKYTWATIADADEIEVLERNYAELRNDKPHDWEVGGHTVMMTFRYHF